MAIMVRRSNKKTLMSGEGGGGSILCSHFYDEKVLWEMSKEFWNNFREVLKKYWGITLKTVYNFDIFMEIFKETEKLRCNFRKQTEKF